MNIAIDGHWVGEASGVATYCRNLFERFPNRLGAGAFAIATASRQGVPAEHVLPARSSYHWARVSWRTWMRTGARAATCGWADS